MDIGLVVYVITNALVAGLGIPLLRRRIKPNGLYGLRIRETLADEDVWYEANARSGRDAIIIGVVGLALSVGLYVAPQVPESTYHSLMIGYLLAAVVLSFIGDVRFAKRLSEERQRSVGQGK